MALFSRSKKSDKTDETTKTVKSVKSTSVVDTNLSGIILGARLSEKTVAASERNVYTFNVRRDANKFQVRDAIKTIYNVTPQRINLVHQAPAKRAKGMTGRTKHVAGQKKAYVFLKEGDSIQLV
jgi:large subunit ribosomal protein L23